MGKGARNRARRANRTRIQLETMYVKPGQHVTERTSVSFEPGDSAPSLADFDRVMNAITRGEYIPRDINREMTDEDTTVLEEFDALYSEAVEMFGSEKVIVTGDGNYPKTLRMYIVEPEEV